MKYLVRVFLFHVFALWLTSQMIPGLVMDDGWQLLLMAGLVLSLLMLIVKPILSILFIPINILTFGLVSWFINVIVIYLLTLLLPEIQINAWTFQGWSGWGFAIPAFEVQYFFSLVGISVLITFFTNVLHEVSEG